MSAPVASSRSRQTARRKPNDDAGYFGPLGGGSTAGAKRHAADKADGEPRVKRKRVEAVTANAMGSGASKDTDADGKSSLVDFTTMPLTVLHRYMTTFDLIPTITPSPLTADDPPPPYSLEQPLRRSSLPPSPPAHSTPANRPQRHSGPGSRGGPQQQLQQQRRRSSPRTGEDYPSRVPVLADIEELNVVLASVVERHFREVIVVSGREEVDTLAAFMCAVEKAKGGRSR